MRAEKPTTTQLGRWGESYVADQLTGQGFVILSRNWHSPYGELDLVAENDRYLAFVEVKLRKGDRFAPGRAAVTKQKQAKIRVTAQLYLKEHPSEKQPRFDVAEVYAPQGMETEHPRLCYIENAFW